MDVGSSSMMLLKRFKISRLIRLAMAAGTLVRRLCVSVNLVMCSRDTVKVINKKNK